MKKIFTTIFSLLTCAGVSAQITFQTRIGGTADEYMWGVCQTSDGGFIVGGFTQSFGAGSSDIYICKTDSAGNVLWKNVFGGTGAEEGSSILATGDGGCVIAGVTGSFGAGGQDVYFFKTDGAGNLAWSKTIGGTNMDGAVAIGLTAEGGYIIAGLTTNFGAASIDIYLMKTDSLGNLLWTKTYGGANYDVATSVCQTIDGGFVISGYTNSYGAGNYDACLLRTDTAGNLLWAKAIGGAGNDYGQIVTQATDGGFVFAGRTNSFGLGTDDIYLVKTDTAGDLLWSKTIGTANGEGSNSLIRTTEGGYVIAGNTLLGAGALDVHLLKTDSAGNLLWSKAFGSSNDDYGNGVYETTDGGYIIGGRTRNFGAGNTDVYLIKTDSEGNSGCYETNVQDSESIPVTVMTSAAMSVSSGGVVNNVTTISGSGGADSSVCFFTVGIQIPSGDEFFFIKLSPNPATNELRIENAELRIREIEIYNTLGEKRLTLNPSPSGEGVRVDVSSLPAGVYFVAVTDDKGNKITRRFIKM